MIIFILDFSDQSCLLNEMYIQKSRVVFDLVTLVYDLVNRVGQQD